MRQSRPKIKHQARSQTLVWKLLYGNSRKLVGTVVQDRTYASMWRVQLPDGSLSGMLNLARAKDAAMVAAGREVADRRSLRWQKPPT
jgi:hypothetical protein